MKPLLIVRVTRPPALRKLSAKQAGYNLELGYSTYPADSTQGLN